MDYLDEIMRQLGSDKAGWAGVTALFLGSGIQKSQIAEIKALYPSIRLSPIFGMRKSSEMTFYAIA